MGDVLVNIETVVGSAHNDVFVAGDAANRLLGGDGHDRMSGGDGNDRLYGGSGADGLDGGGGHDWLEGGAGQDILTGGSGSDGFFCYVVSKSAAGSADRITDFSQAEQDLIWLSPIDADTNTDGDQKFTFVGTASFTETAGELRCEHRDGDTLVQGDANGDKADLEIRLTGTIELTADDFML